MRLDTMETYCLRCAKALVELLSMETRDRTQERQVHSLLESLGRYSEFLICNECGAKDYPRLTCDADKLRERGVCFYCNCWIDRLPMRDEARVARIGGYHYVIGKEDPNIPLRNRGSAGQKYVIHFFDGREVTTTNLWHQGEIPAHFRERLPDNAEWGGKP
jgi:hypothetical protein